MTRSKKQTLNPNAKTTTRITRFSGKLKKAVITGLIFAAASFGGRMLLPSGALAKGKEVKRPAPVKVVEDEKPVLLAQLDPKKNGSKEPAKAKEEPVLLAQLGNTNIPKSIYTSEVKETLYLNPDSLEQYTEIPVIIRVTGEDAKKRENIPITAYNQDGTKISTIYTDSNGDAKFTFTEPGKYSFSQNGYDKRALVLNVKKMATVSLKEMRKLAKETTRENGYWVMLDADATSPYITATVQTKDVTFAVRVIMSDPTKRSLIKNPELTIVLDKTAICFGDSSPLPYKKTFRTSLIPLKKMYEKINGTEMKYVRLVIKRNVQEVITKNGVQEKIKYTQLYVVPVDKPNGKIEDGVPVISKAIANNGKVYSMSPELISR